MYRSLAGLAGGTLFLGVGADLEDAARELQEALQGLDLDLLGVLHHALQGVEGDLLDLEQEALHLEWEALDELSQDLPDLAFDRGRGLEVLEFVEHHLGEVVELDDGLHEAGVVVLEDLDDDLERGLLDDLRGVLAVDGQRRVLG